MPKINGLSPKQKLFIKEYFIDRNATQAAIRAGYSKKSAGQIAEQNLRKLEIRKAIDLGMEKIFNSLDITAARNLKERARLAYYDTGDIAKEKITCPADIAKLPYDLRQAIVGWKWDSKGNFVLEIADKNAHLTALDKHLGIYEVDNNQKTNPLRDLLETLSGNVLGVAKSSCDD